MHQWPHHASIHTMLYSWHTTLKYNVHTYRQLLWHGSSFYLSLFYHICTWLVSGEKIAYKVWWPLLFAGWQLLQTHDLPAHYKIIKSLLFYPVHSNSCLLSTFILCATMLRLILKNIDMDKLMLETGHSSITEVLSINKAEGLLSTYQEMLII